MDSNDTEHVRILEEYCASEDISLDGLREKLQQITQPIALACSHFLHELCLNKNITLDMVQLVLNNNPYAAYCVSNRYNGISYTDEDVDRYEEEQKEAEDKSPSLSPRKHKCSSDRTFPIHLAASNVHCPNSVVELLAKSNPSAIRHLSKLTVGHNKEGIGSLESTPLHCYLSRASNLQLDTVQILVELCPESLKLSLSGSEQPYFPIHAIIDNPEVGSYCGVVQYLVDTDPTILQCRDEDRQTPLHMVCRRSTTTASLAQILVDGCQDTARESDCNGSLPIHQLCENEVLEQGVKLDILRILINVYVYPESLHTSRNISQILPIHIACRYQDPDFCKVLVDEYPGSLRLEDRNGYLPFHTACVTGSLETVQYLYEADRECINKCTTSGLYPLHTALMTQRKDQYEIIKFLLQCDPNCAAVALPNVVGDHILLPLHLACDRGANLETIQLLFDAYPAAIYTEEGPETFISIPNAAEKSRGFLRRQMYDITRFCKNADLAFPLPHHRAVKSDVTLGVFKLLVEQLPQNEHEDACEQRQDNEGKTTLHLACQYEKIGIVRYLIPISKGVVSVPDADGNYPLHLACREGYCDIINSLLEANTISVSIQNSDKNLPIELLIESDCDQDSLVYTEAVWRLLVASPPTF